MPELLNEALMCGAPSSLVILHGWLLSSVTAPCNHGANEGSWHGVRMAGALVKCMHQTEYNRGLFLVVLRVPFMYI